VVHACLTLAPHICASHLHTNPILLHHHQKEMQKIDDICFLLHSVRR
jgi:hypothetical protein